jgi:hypothetical protein
VIQKNKLLILCVLIMCHSNNYTHETQKKSLECSGKVAKIRLQLFVDAEKNEQNLIDTRAQCLQIDDCETNQAFQQAKRVVLGSIVILEKHLEELEKGKASECSVCERTETIDIKDRLTQLLKSSQ